MRRRAFALALIGGALGGATWLCAGAAAAERAPRLALLQQPVQQQPQPSRPEDDFELLPPEKPPDAAAVARQAELSRTLSTRRQILRLHQLGGFATLATMTATVIVGQLNYMDKYGGGGDTGKYRLTHQVLAYSTSGVFAATGLLALFAPSPFDKPLRFDTATLHKAGRTGVETAADAAEALRPLAGDGAVVLLALGLIGSGFGGSGFTGSGFTRMARGV